MEDLTYLSKEEEQERKERSEVLLLWLAIASIVMVFAGLTSAYVVRQAEGNWWYFDLPNLFYINTAVIIVSSITLILASVNIKKDNIQQTKIFMLLSLILGFVFVFIQFKGWGVLVENGIFFAGAESNAAGSYLYAISGVHLAHIFGGILTLLITTIKTFGGKYNSKSYNGIRLASIFWHFLGILWIYLFGFLIFIR